MGEIGVEWSNKPFRLIAGSVTAHAEPSPAPEPPAG